MNSRKSWQSTHRGNTAFWCSDAHCSLLQPGPAATPVPGGPKPSQRSVSPDLCSDVLRFFRRSVCNEQSTEQSTSPTKMTGVAQPEHDPAALQQPCPVAWVLACVTRLTWRERFTGRRFILHWFTGRSALVFNSLGFSSSADEDFWPIQLGHGFKCHLALSLMNTGISNLLSLSYTHQYFK